MDNYELMQATTQERYRAHHKPQIEQGRTAQPLFFGVIPAVALEIKMTIFAGRAAGGVKLSRI